MNEPAQKLTTADRLVIPAFFMPGFRTSIAIQNGVERNLLFRTWGGIGDQICAEPTLRFALKSFKGCRVSLASERPELFRHLKFDQVFDLNKEKPEYDKYLCFETITPPDESNMVWQFFSHMLTNCVDFPSMCALRCQLPVAEKEVFLEPAFPSKIYLSEKQVWIHAGRHWPSKTFPAEWWNQVLAKVQDNGFQPVLVGANTDDNRGTVEVDPSGCLDLRNKLSMNDSVWHLQRCGVLLTNDSAPLHMAASSASTWIGYVATCKHPDYISHWRQGQWAYRMKNLGLGGIWDVVDYCPNRQQKVTADKVEPELLASWLPEPKEFALWGCAHATTADSVRLPA